MRVLVTGGAGFIGSHFARYMRKKYPLYTIINLDDLTYAGNLENLRDIEHSDRYHFVKGNISDVAVVDKVFAQGIDLVVNFAAESHVDRSITDAAMFVQSNVVGTHVLLEAAKRYPVQKYLQVSTDEVYGSLGSTGYFTEQSSLAPNSPYSASKAGADMLVRAYFETYQLPVTISRCSNNYGPYQNPEKLIPRMITHAYQGRPLPLYGDGLNVRDWLHVYDHCAALDLILHEAAPGAVYNVGGNNERTNLEIAKAILRLLDQPEGLIQFVTDRQGHDRRYAIDSTKLQADLGWRPIYTFEEGLQETVCWYLSHREWWQSEGFAS